MNAYPYSFSVSFFTRRILIFQSREDTKTRLRAFVLSREPPNRDAWHRSERRSHCSSGRLMSVVRLRLDESAGQIFRRTGEWNPFDAGRLDAGRCGRDITAVTLTVGPDKSRWKFHYGIRKTGVKRRTVTSQCRRCRWLWSPRLMTMAMELHSPQSRQRMLRGLSIVRRSRSVMVVSSQNDGFLNRTIDGTNLTFRERSKSFIWSHILLES